MVGINEAALLVQADVKLPFRILLNNFSQLYFYSSVKQAGKALNRGCFFF